MVDKVKPLKIENSTDGTQDDLSFYTETNPQEDYLAARGLSIGNSDNYLIHTKDNEISFLDNINGEVKLSELSNDGKLKVSSNDTISGYLNGKLIAGTNIQFVENNIGSDETLIINSVQDLDNLSDIPTKPVSGTKIIQSIDGIINWIDTPSGGSGITTASYVSFGINPGIAVSSGFLKTTGGSLLGYSLPTDGIINSIGVLTDENNSLSYNLLKNGYVIDTIIFANQKSKINDNLSLAYNKYDIITAQIVGGTNIESHFNSDSNTLFLSHFDGDNAVYKCVTNFGEGKGMSGRLVDSANFNTIRKFGTHSIDFDGIDDYIQFLHHNNYEVQNCTIEFFFYADDVSGTQYMFSKDHSDYETGGLLTIGLVGTDIYVRSQSTNNSKTIQFSSSVSTNTWYHIAVVLGVGGIKVFLDGILSASDGTWLMGLEGNRESFILGAGMTTNDEDCFDVIDDHFNGKIDEFRFSNTRRYESDFTVPTSVFIKDDTTLGLYHFDEGNGFLAYDESDIVHSASLMSRNMSPIIEVVSRIGTHSVLTNNGSNDYNWLRINHNKLYESTTITIEMWLFPKDTGGNNVIIQKGTSATEGGIIAKWFDADDKIRVYYYGLSTFRTLVTGIDSFRNNHWSHMSITIDSSIINIYVNGSLDCYENLTTDYQNVLLNNKEDIYMASTNEGTDFFSSYYDEIRISNNMRTYIKPNVSDISMVVGI